MHVLKKGWFRALLFIPAAIIGMVLPGFLYLIPGFKNWPYNATASTIFGAGAIYLIIFLLNKYIDKTEGDFFGLRFVSKDFFSGIAIGFVLVVLASTLMLAMGWVQFKSKPFDLAGFINGLVLMVFVGVLEELMSRTYFLKNLMLSVNKYVALVITASIFSALHLPNEGADWFSTLEIFFAGILLGIWYIEVGNIWLPIGLHFSWNFVQGYLMGFEVSGHVSTGALLEQRDIASKFLSGGIFGLEGSIAGLAATILGSILVYFLAKKRA